jgi:hypothetical protein
MDEEKKKGDPQKPSHDEKWVEKLSAAKGGTPAGVTTYVGLLRESPADNTAYHLYLTLDMGSYLQIQKDDVLHLENLPPDKSPFGSLGGARVYVRLGATVKSIRTSTNTFSAGAADEFDLDIRLGGRRTATGGGGGPQTIPDTGCGPDCGNIPPFTDPDSATCNTCAFTCVGCPDTINTCPCPPTGGGFTCFPICRPITRSFTCVTNCGTCNTCATNCGTCNTCQTCRTNCGTCQTQCGTCQTCQTRCGQETCIACTHIFTECNQHTCGPGRGCGVIP